MRFLKTAAKIELNSILRKEFLVKGNILTLNLT